MSSRLSKHQENWLVLYLVKTKAFLFCWAVCQVIQVGFENWDSLQCNKTLPTRLPPMEGQQKKIEYPGWHKNTTGKKLWSGENDEVSEMFEEI